MNVVLGLLGFMAIVLAIGFVIQYFDDEREERRKELAKGVRKAQEERYNKVTEEYEARKQKAAPRREAPVTVASPKPVTGNWKAPEPTPTPHNDLLMTALVVDSLSEPSYTEPSRTESYSTPSYSSCDYGSSSSSDSSSSYDSSSSSSCDSSSSY